MVAQCISNPMIFIVLLCHKMFFKKSAMAEKYQIERFNTSGGQ